MILIVSFLWIASFHKLNDATWTLGVLCNFLGGKKLQTHLSNVVSHCIFIKFVSFVNQFNIFDCLILSTAFDVWSKIVRMIKITRRKVVCNHFEIISILVIEVILDKYYLNKNCVV